VTRSYTKMLTNRNYKDEVSSAEYVRWVFDDPSIPASKAAVWMAIVRSNDLKAMKRCAKDVRKRLMLLHQRECDDDGFQRYQTRTIHKL